MVTADLGIATVGVMFVSETVTGWVGAAAVVRAASTALVPADVLAAMLATVVAAAGVEGEMIGSSEIASSEIASRAAEVVPG
jgi:hypothetical protein